MGSEKYSGMPHGVAITLCSVYALFVVLDDPKLNVMVIHLDDGAVELIAFGRHTSRACWQRPIRRARFVVPTYFKAPRPKCPIQ